MYNKIVNPITGRKVNINTKLGKKIINNYIFFYNQLQEGGMHPAFIYVNVRNAINDKDEAVWEWLSKERLDKPRGVFTYISNELSKQENDIIIKKMIKNLGEHISELKIIIEDKKMSDLEKKNSILKFLDDENQELEPLKIEYCKVCNEPNCRRGIRCGRSYNFEEEPL